PTEASSPGTPATRDGRRREPTGRDVDRRALTGCAAMRLSLLLTLLLSSSAFAAKAPVALEAPAARFAEAITSGKEEAASALIDTDALTDEAVKGLKVPSDFVAQLRDGQRKAAAALTTQLVKNVAQGATFKLLTTQGGKRPVSI